LVLFLIENSQFHSELMPSLGAMQIVFLTRVNSGFFMNIKPCFSSADSTSSKTLKYKGFPDFI